MSKFLFTNLWTDDLGLPTRTVPIASELAKRGHHVTFCNPAPSPTKIIKQAGFENVTPRLRHLPTIFSPMTPYMWNMDHCASMGGYLDEMFVRDSVEVLMKLMDDLEVDAVVDSWNLSACMAARVSQKPLVSIIQADMHPANPGLMWWREPPDDIPTPVPVINKVLSDYGLPQVKSVGELHVGDLTLCVGIPETDPIPQTENITHVGPIFFQTPDAKLPDWIVAFGKDKPLIWVYAGTPQYQSLASVMDSVVVLQASIAALADEDVRVVMTTGHQELPDELSPLPDNFRHELFLPGTLLAEKSDLMIHHGGHGSCMTAVYAGTPAVIVPTISERESNARRLGALGVAEFLVPEIDQSGEKKLSAEELRDKVRQVLSNPSFAQEAGKLGEKMRTYGGAAQAAYLIEDFILHF